MKKFLIGSVVAVLCTGAPAVYADDTHQHEHGSAPESKSSSSAGDSSVADMQMGKAQERMKQAQALMAKLRETRDPAERRKLMQQHTQAMRDTMGMMSMHQMMEERMEMMQMMMEQMFERQEMLMQGGK